MSESFYWSISPSPYIGSEGSAFLRADSEADHRKALEFAQQRLEEGWDSLEVGDSFSVTLELCRGNINSARARSRRAEGRAK